MLGLSCAVVPDAAHIKGCSKAYLIATAATDVCQHSRNVAVIEQQNKWRHAERTWVARQLTPPSVAAQPAPDFDVDQSVNW